MHPCCQTTYLHTETQPVLSIRCISVTATAPPLLKCGSASTHGTTSTSACRVRHLTSSLLCQCALPIASNRLSPEVPQQLDTIV